MRQAEREAANAASREPVPRPTLKIFPPSDDMSAQAVLPTAPVSDQSYRTAGGRELWLPADFKQLEPTPELLAELADASARLETAQPEEIIQWAHDRFAPHLTM